MAKQAERREASREAIVTAATELFGRAGFGPTSMDHIAAASGVAKGSVYYYFPTKEILFETVLDRASADLARAVAGVAQRADDVLDALAKGVEAYFEACSQGPRAQIILKDGPVVLGWSRWREIDERHFGQAIPNALAAAIGAGLIDEQPIAPLSRLLLGAVTEAAVACAASPEPITAGRRYADALARLLRGLRRDFQEQKGSVCLPADKLRGERL
jgi:AcrR family transcriptional regulator